MDWNLDCAQNIDASAREATRSTRAAHLPIPHLPRFRHLEGCCRRPPKGRNERFRAPQPSQTSVRLGHEWEHANLAISQVGMLQNGDFPANLIPLSGRAPRRLSPICAETGLKTSQNESHLRKCAECWPRGVCEERIGACEVARCVGGGFGCCVRNSTGRQRGSASRGVSGSASRGGTP